MFLSGLAASLLVNRLSGQRINRASKGRGINRAGEGIVRADNGNENSKMDS